MAYKGIGHQHKFLLRNLLTLLTCCCGGAKRLVAIPPLVLIIKGSKGTPELALEWEAFVVLMIFYDGQYKKNTNETSEFLTISEWKNTGPSRVELNSHTGSRLLGCL